MPTDFTPSPALANRNIHQGNSVDNSTPVVSNGWIKEHAAIAPYLALVQRSARNAGISPYFQAAVLAQENGGFDRWSTNAKSSADANGIAQFIPSTWAGSWNPYRNQSPNNPQYAIPAQSIYLRRLLRDNGGSMDRAAGAYYGAMDPRYIDGVKAYFNELTQNNVFGSSSNFPSVKVGTAGPGGIDGALNAIGGAAGDVLGVATDAIDAVPKLIDTLLHPEKLGELIAEAFGIFLRFVFKAIWKYVLAPPFHWCQRAVIYYFENIMGSQDGENSGYYYDYAAAVTVAFWSVGYGILFRDSADPSIKASRPEDTSIGRMINTVSGFVAKRNVSSPDKVKEQTPDKPEPRTSEVKLEKVTQLSAVRRRQISIGTGAENGRNESREGNENLTTDADAANDDAENAA